ncbi:hypothetical protein [Streptomyces sp. NPDC088794]|uniref:hypothetical protein n=1 Tax=Streptomyces sp. NPDC088794 TaxID=3365902 RepID=UPI00382C31C4
MTVLERTSTVQRYARSLTAAVVTVVTLILAANAGPARATGPEPAREQVRHTTTQR